MRCLVSLRMATGVAGNLFAADEIKIDENQTICAQVGPGCRLGGGPELGRARGGFKSKARPALQPLLQCPGRESLRTGGNLQTGRSATARGFRRARARSTADGRRTRGRK